MPDLFMALRADDQRGWHAGQIVTVAKGEAPRLTTTKAIRPLPAGTTVTRCDDCNVTFADTRYHGQHVVEAHTAPAAPEPTKFPPAPPTGEATHPADLTEGDEQHGDDTAEEEPA